MRSTKSILGLATAAMLASAVSANAAIWGLTEDKGTAYTLPELGDVVESFNPNEANNSKGPNELRYMFQQLGLGLGDHQVVVGGELNLLVDTLSLTFTFLGREAGAVSSVFDAVQGGDVLTNDFKGPLSFTTGPVKAASPLAFRFESTFKGATGTEFPDGTSVVNGQKEEDFNGAQIAFLISPFNDNVVWAFFDDGGGPDMQIAGCRTRDCDFDDMIVRIEATVVPLPAAGFLLVGALGGLGLMARRRRA